MSTGYLEEVLKDTFLSYSAFVLQQRALPDVRDGFKYTGRQIIHAQAREKLDHKHPFKKSQKSAAAATSFSYVHGGASAYGQIIRLGRPLVQRYYLEEITGNGGTPTASDTYSAERYTEARLSPLTAEILKYLDMNALEERDWAETYDGEGKFPTCFPAVGFDNICNGSFGSIGVGLVSSIPQFNLREVNETICALIDDPSFEVALLPDFASGGILLNPQTTLASLSTGEGKSALLRGVVKKYPKEGYLEVLEAPYGVYTDTICLELEKAIDAGLSCITSFKDLSKRTVQIRIFSKDLDTLEEWLYKNTSVQKYFTIKMTMLHNGKTPKIYSMKEALQAHIDHAKLMFRRQYLFQIEQLKARQNILEGLIKAHSILDEVIARVRESHGRANVVENLMTSFGFNQAQAEYIADVKTHRWSALDIVALEEELSENLAKQNEILKILENKILFNEHLKEIYTEIASKFGDSRRTKIYDQIQYEFGFDGERPNRDFWIINTDEGYFATYTDEIENKIIGTRISPEDDLIFLSRNFRAFSRKGKDLCIGSIADCIDFGKDDEMFCVIKADDLSLFNYVQIVEEGEEPYAMHSSFIGLPASKRGKKIKPGEHKLVSIELTKNRN